MVKTLNFFSDPGHGWLKVKKAELVKFGLIESISSYSYERNDSVYLEEDCDAPKYINVLKALNIQFKVKESTTNKSSKIRSYSRYVGNA